MCVIGSACVVGWVVWRVSVTVRVRVLVVLWWRVVGRIMVVLIMAMGAIAVVMAVAAVALGRW